MQNDLVTLIAIFAGTLILVWLLPLSYKKESKLLENWLKKNNFELISHEQRIFRKGPFWASSIAQLVYLVEVKDVDGNIKVGFVMFGGPWLGILKRQENIEEKVAWSQ